MASKDKKDKLEEVAARESADSAAYEGELDESNNLIELTDEDGVKTLFEYLTTIPYENSEYVVLMVVDEDDELEDEEDDDEYDDEGEVVILRIETDENGEDTYVTCEDEAVSQKVFEMFMEQVEAEQD